MTVLTFPSILPARITWELESNTRTFESPLTKSVQTLEAPGSRWKATLSYNDLSQAEARALFAFLSQLRGQAGRFYLYDHSLPDPIGTPEGSTPLVKGAGQTGTSIETDGWYSDAVFWDDLPGYVDDFTGLFDDLGIGSEGFFALKAGDYIEFNDELKIIVEDVEVDPSGNATIIFEPPIRNAPADNEPITWDKPTCIMRLADDSQAKMGVSPPFATTFTISCVESFTS